MIESLPEDYEIHIYSCNKLSHRWHVVLVYTARDGQEQDEIKNIKCDTISYGMGILEEYIQSETFKQHKKLEERNL